MINTDELLERVDFKHFRFYDGKFDETPTGGYTLGFVDSEHEFYTLFISKCSDSDVFSKSRGREESFKRIFTIPKIVGNPLIDLIFKCYSAVYFDNITDRVFRDFAKTIIKGTVDLRPKSYADSETIRLALVHIRHLKDCA